MGVDVERAEGLEEGRMGDGEESREGDTNDGVHDDGMVSLL